MNFVLRLKNKTTLVALIAALVPFVYQVLSIFGVTPAIAEETWINIAGLVINLLVGLGIVVDPTTKGITDSALAQTYKTPSDGSYEVEDNGDTVSITVDKYNGNKNSEIGVSEEEVDELDEDE